MDQSFDIIIIGAGIAGASAAYFLGLGGGPAQRVLLLEREAHPGFHSTGRSAAVYFESYGTAQIRALTTASRDFLASPPAGFCEHPILAPRGALTVAGPGQEQQLDEQLDIVRSVSAKAARLSSAQALELVPVLRPELLIGAVHEPDAFDMDVNALHQGFLRGARAQGTQLQCDTEVLKLERDRGGWLLHTRRRRHDDRGQLIMTDETLRAAQVVNAAGAWCDEIARRAGLHGIGLQPKRRSAFLFNAPDGQDASRWPMFIGVDESWYVKPDARVLLGSPANADPVDAHDVQPEEFDIAVGIDRIQNATTMQIRRPIRTWAGLRSFVGDGGLVIGARDGEPGFVWLSAQGGYGIQTSPAAGACAAALLRGEALPDTVLARGSSVAGLSPDRLPVA